jgi:hypothetical protein
VTHAVPNAIEQWLAGQHRHGSIVRLRRRPWEYATSTALELVTAVLDDGSEREFVLKHLGTREMSKHARRAKPSFVLDPQREIEVYRRLLAPLQIGPRLVGSSVSSQEGRNWLLIEFVNGYRLHEVGDFTTWVAVATSGTADSVRPRVVYGLDESRPPFFRLR